MWSILGEYVIQQKAVLPVSGPMFTGTVSTDPHRRCWCLQSPFRAPLTGRRLNCSKQQQWNSVKLSYTSWGTSRRPQWWSEGKRAWMQRSCSVSPGFTSGADRFLLSVQDCSARSRHSQILSSQNQYFNVKMRQIWQTSRLPIHSQHRRSTSWRLTTCWHHSCCMCVCFSNSEVKVKVCLRWHVRIVAHTKPRWFVVWWLQSLRFFSLGVKRSCCTVNFHCCCCRHVQFNHAPKST